MHASYCQLIHVHVKLECHKLQRVDLCDDQVSLRDGLVFLLREQGHLDDLANFEALCGVNTDLVKVRLLIRGGELLGGWCRRIINDDVTVGSEDHKALWAVWPQLRPEALRDGLGVFKQLLGHDC